MPAPRVLYSFPDTLGKPGIGTTALEQVRSLARLGLDVHVAATSLAEDPGVPCTLTLSAAGRRVPHRALGRDRAGSLRAYAWHDRRVAGCSGAGARRSTSSIAGRRPRSRRARQRSRAEPAGAPPGSEHPHRSRHRDGERAAPRSSACRSVPMTCTATRPSSSPASRREYDAVDRVLVPSEHAARTFADNGVPAERIALHRFGCDLERFAPRCRARGQRPFTMLFAGRGEPAKGLHLALRAWSDSGIGSGGTARHLR